MTANSSRITERCTGVASLEGLVRTKRAEKPREEENDGRKEDKKERIVDERIGLGGQIRKREKLRGQWEKGKSSEDRGE
eukprot:gene5088-205_t